MKHLLYALTLFTFSAAAQELVYVWVDGMFGWISIPYTTNLVVPLQSPSYR